MTLIEVETKLGKNGMIQIPETELKATGLREGDEISLLYVAVDENDPKNGTGEFMLERKAN